MGQSRDRRARAFCCRQPCLGAHIVCCGGQPDACIAPFCCGGLLRSVRQRETPRTVSLGKRSGVFRVGGQTGATRRSRTGQCRHLAAPRNKLYARPNRAADNKMHEHGDHGSAPSHPPGLNQWTGRRWASAAATNGARASATRHSVIRATTGPPRPNVPCRRQAQNRSCRTGMARRRG